MPMAMQVSEVPPELDFGEDTGFDLDACVRHGLVRGVGRVSSGTDRRVGFLACGPPQFDVHVPVLVFGRPVALV